MGGDGRGRKGGGCQRKTWWRRSDDGPGTARRSVAFGLHGGSTGVRGGSWRGGGGRGQGHRVQGQCRRQVGMGTWATGVSRPRFQGDRSSDPLGSRDAFAEPTRPVDLGIGRPPSARQDGPSGHRRSRSGRRLSKSGGRRREGRRHGSQQRSSRGSTGHRGGRAGRHGQRAVEVDGFRLGTVVFRQEEFLGRRGGDGADIDRDGPKTAKALLSRHQRPRAFGRWSRA